jgi:hypothetical protein
MVSVGDGNSGSSGCDWAKASERHKRRSAAVTLTEEMVRKGLGVDSSCRRWVDGGGVGGHGHPGRHRNNNNTTVAQRDEVIRRTIYVFNIDHSYLNLGSN